MKRFLCVILALSLMASAFVFTAQAAGSVNFSARVVSDSSGNAKLVFSLNSGSGLGAFKLYVSYDPNVFQISGTTSQAYTSNLTGTEASNMLWAVNSSKYNQNISGNTASESKVIVGGVYNGTSGLTNGGDIFTLNFTIKSGAPDGNSVFRVSKGEMAYADGTRCEAAATVPDSITVTIANGVVNGTTISQTASDVILPFDSTTNFSTYFATTRAIESNEKKEGTGSMRMGFSSPTGQSGNVGGMLKYSFSSARDLSKYTSFSMNIYTPLAMEGYGGSFQVNFISSGTDDGYNFNCDISNISTGWNTISFTKSTPTATANNPNWSSITCIRLTWFNNSQISRQFFLLDNLVGYYGGASITTSTPSSTPSSVTSSATSSTTSTGTIVSTPDAANAFDQWTSFTNETHHSWTFVQNNYANDSKHAAVAQEFIPARPYISGASLRLFMSSGATGYVRFSIRSSLTEVLDQSYEVFGNNYLYGGANTNTWCVADFTSDNDGWNRTVKVTPGQKYYLVYYYVLLNDNGATIYNVLDSTGTTQENCAWISVYPNTTFTRNPTWVAPFDIHYDNEVEHVENLINVIGTVTTGSLSAINSARNAYNALTASQQKILKSEYGGTAYDKLVAAETAYNALPKAYGDLNGDGIVHASDALMALKAAAGKLTLTAEQQVLANVDGSSGVSATDATTILQYAIGKISTFSAVTTTVPAAVTSGYNPGVSSSYKVTATVGSTSNIASGTTFTVPVTLSSYSKGYAYVTVSTPTFDTSMLTFNGFQTGSGFTSSNSYIQNTSSLYAVMPSGTITSGEVVKLKFTAKKNISTTTSITTGVYASVYTDSNQVNNSGATVTVNAGTITPPAAPTFTISSTNNVASQQTMTLSITSAVGITGYYWGTSSSYLGNDFNSTTSLTPSRTVSSSGTRYITIVDAFGNVSETKTITYYKTTLDSNGGTDARTSVLTCSGKSFKFPVYTRDGYSFKGWSTDSLATSGGIDYLTPTSNATYYAVWRDTTVPTASVTSTNNVADSQTLTFTLSDNDALAGYYFGTNTNYKNNLYTISSSTSVDLVVSEAGTYYFTAKDATGNVSSTISVTFYATTFNGNGGDLNGLSTIITKAGNSFDASAATRDGYTFAGWSTDVDATEGLNTITVNSDQTYYAVWTDATAPSATISSTNNVASSQTLTFNLQDNEGVDGYWFGKEATYDSNLYYSANETTYEVSDSGVYYLTVKDNAGNISTTYTVTFYKTTLDGNGGETELSYVLTKAGESFIFPAATNEDLACLGWSTNSGATSGVSALTPTEDSTYYAIWGGNTVPTISVGCTNNASSSQTITFTFDGKNSGISGYYFGTSANYEDNGLVSYTDTTLEIEINEAGIYYITVVNEYGTVSATTAIIFYEITLNGNGGTAGIETIIVRDGDTVVLPEATKDGYTYNGWSTDSNATMGETSITAVANNTYYATWIDATKPVGSMTATNNVATSQTVNITLSDNETLKGYYFGTSANYEENEFFTTSALSAIQTVTESGTYYLTVVDAAGNISETVSLTFYKTVLNANGGTVDIDYVITLEGNSFDAPAAYYYGYKFLGWSANADADSGVNSITPIADQTYYAIWEEITTPVVTLQNTNNIASSQTVTLNIETNADIAGYWWGTSPDFTQNTFVESSDLNIVKDVYTAGTYYFTAMDIYGNLTNTVSVTFYEIVLNADGGVLGTSIILAEKGVQIDLPSPTKSGNTFKGWSANGNADSVVTTITPVSNATYRAIWEGTTKPTISLDITNNLSSEQEVTININSTVGIEGYWFGTADDYEYSVLAESITVTVNDAGTYYFAVKDINGNISNVLYVTFYKTVLNKNDGTGSTETILTRAGSSFKLSTIPQYEGYTFNGWSTNPDATSGIYTITPTGNTTYYAVWVNNITLTATVDNVIANKGQQVKIPVKMGEQNNPYASIVINGVTYNDSVLEFVGFEIPENEFFHNGVYAVIDGGKYYVFNSPANAEEAAATCGGDIAIAYLVFNVIEDCMEASPVSVTFDAEQTTVYVDGNWIDICKAAAITVTEGSVLSEPDEEAPVGTIESTNNVSNNQTVTITLSDNKGVKGYHFGRSDNYTENTYYEFTTDVVNALIEVEGTYYLTVVDIYENVSETVSITFSRIILNANGGSVEPEYLIVEQGNQIDLPVASLSGYTLLGWSTDENATSGITTITVTGDETYYALWENDAEKAQIVIDMIDSIGEVTLESEEAILAARAAYNALSDSQKDLVTNIQTLVDAEEYLRRLKNILLGDLDADGEVTVIDAFRVLQATVKKVTLDNLELYVADVDGRTGISVYDALLIMQKAVGKISIFPVEEE